MHYKHKKHAVKAISAFMALVFALLCAPCLTAFALEGDNNPEAAEETFEPYVAVVNNVGGYALLNNPEDVDWIPYGGKINVTSEYFSEDGIEYIKGIYEEKSVDVQKSYVVREENFKPLTKEEIASIIADQESNIQANVEETTKPVETTTATPKVILPKEIKVTCKSKSVNVGKTVKMIASEKGVVWDSENPDIAAVDRNGTVTGKKTGRAVITAGLTDDKGNSVKGSCVIQVVEENSKSAFPENISVAGYRYSKRDSYFYVDKNNAWQGNFGYNQAYDLVAPYLMLEYDYVRVYFTYKNKDWMVQLWKGQYGLVFYGCEAGIYNKAASGKDDSVVTTYSHATGGNIPYMQTTLYHDANLSGNYSRVFSTPYEQTWWSTGFKPGHLRRTEPASELRQTGIISFDNEEMAKLFAEGLEECRFKKAESVKEISPDTYCIDGTDVYYSWQNISEAESTMPVKTGIAAFSFVTLFGMFITLLMVLGGAMMMGLLFLI